MDQQKIGAFIVSNRKSRGMTQAQLAEHLSITSKAVSKWETGRTESASPQLCFSALKAVRRRLHFFVKVNQPPDIFFH